MHACARYVQHTLRVRRMRQQHEDIMLHDMLLDCHALPVMICDV